MPLTGGYKAIIDAVDAPLVEKYNWNAKASSGGLMYARTRARGMKHSRMHRLILDAPDGMEVDHRDGDTLDNRRQNLRLANSSQNKWNARRRSDNTSGFKGVYYFKRDGTWQAQITKGGKRIHIGYFATPEEAHEARCAAALSLHGEFARMA